jgi:hypothetical protein
VLPARGGFAVVSPDGQGRVLGLQSWGALGQIDDLARMPRIVRSALEVRLLHPEGHGYFAMLREKLHWGAAVLRQ